MQLYIHIPFCVRKCAYCDFLSAPRTGEEKKAYLEALCRDIAAGAAEVTEPVETVYFGGGTPSLLEVEELRRLMTLLADSYRIAPDAEITLEVNPGTVTADKLRGYRACGINRLSIGLQSCEDAELRLLGRIHTYNDFLQTYQEARAAGFTNISVDLISCLPGQSEETWRHNLSRVIALEPEHISVYDLIIEEGTPFFERYYDRPELFPSEEAQADRYRLTGAILAKAGYARYEISNYAQAGYESRHNLGYWTGKEYLGFGLGAASYYKGRRFSKVSTFSEYLQTPGIAREEVLRVRDQKNEFFMLGLRTVRGVTENDFLARFGEPIGEEYRTVLEKYQKQQFVLCEGGRYAFTEAGMLVSNVILAELLAEDMPPE